MPRCETCKHSGDDHPEDGEAEVFPCAWCDCPDYDPELVS